MPGGIIIRIVLFPSTTVYISCKIQARLLAQTWRQVDFQYVWIPFDPRVQTLRGLDYLLSILY